MNNDKILIVENNQIILDTFKNCFNAEEIKNVDFASSAEEAIEKMDLNQYSKIIAEYKMSDSIDIFSEAKNRNIGERIMITASARCPINSTEATCGFRKPLTMRSIRQICLEDKECIDSLLKIMHHSA